MERGHEATSKKLKHSLTTSLLTFNLTPLVTTPQRTNPFFNYWRLPINLTCLSLASHELKFKQSSSLHPKKSPGYDLITSQILQELPPSVFNAVLFHTYFPAQWKVAQILLILKPGKPPNELPSYRPISLLPLIS
jgi:hypothetical protein